MIERVSLTRYSCLYVMNDQVGIRETVIYVREMRRKEERSKQGHTNSKAKQHSTPKAVTFPKKIELPRVGLQPMTLYM